MMTSPPAVVDTERPEFVAKKSVARSCLWISVMTGAKLPATTAFAATVLEIDTFWPAIVMSPCAGVPVNENVCCSPAPAPANVRVVVGSINTEPNWFLEVALKTGISPTCCPAVPFNTGKPFHSVLLEIWTICCLSCWNSKSK